MPAPTARGNEYNTDVHCTPPRQPRHSLRHCLSSIRRQLTYINRESERDLAWRARSASRRHERCESKKPAPFLLNHLWDRLDFDYLFRHRTRLPQYHHTANLDLRALLETCLYKSTYESKSGKPGIFNAWHDWESHIAPILFSGCEDAAWIVRCRPGASKKRCKNSDLCPLCLWLDRVRLLVQGFGVRSGSYSRAQAWYFITIGITTNPANSRARFKIYGQKDQDKQGSPDYDPYPVLIDDRTEGMDTPQAYDDARLLASSMQASLDSLYKRGRRMRGLVDGYRAKIECAFRVRQPETRVNIHLHAVANGDETGGSYLAEEVFAELTRLVESEPTLRGRYFANVLFEAIPNADKLESVFKYLEKLLPVDSIVADAQRDPRARLANGSWSDGYMEDIDLALHDLIDDHLLNLLTGYQLDDGEGCTRRRKAVGNMVFKDHGCIGREPAWYRRLRKKRKKARVKRTTAQATA